MKALLQKLTTREILTAKEAESLMDAIMSDQLRPEQIGFVLAVYEFRSPKGEELAGFARALLRRSRSLNAPGDELVDVCGTGGDGLGMFNVSTCVAFVVAGAGLKVAKHGNRAVSSRCGSFDVLEALSIPVAHGPEEAREYLERFGIGFLFAPSFHPAFGMLSPIRRNLGVRTVLNALGPLLNPARVKRQLIGVYSEKLLVPMAEALRELGTLEAMIVHGEDGSDEITLTTKTKVAHLKNGVIRNFEIDPLRLGFSATVSAEHIGGEAMENARILLSVLEGEKGSHRDITVINAAAALMIGGAAESIEEGILLARTTIDQGRALNLLNNLRAGVLLEASGS